MPRRSLFVALACMFSLVGIAQQSSSGRALKASDLQNDVAVLRSAYETLHPGLYRYNTKQQMDAAFEHLSAQLDHDQSLQDAYLAFSVFAAQIKCGHTYANFFNQPDFVADQLFKSPTRLPFYFNWLDHHMVVTTDFTPTHELPRGTEILAINGTPSTDVLARLMTIARADGSNDAKRVASLNVSGDSNFETFDIFYPIFFPEKSTTFTLLIQRLSGPKPGLIQVEALSYEQRIAPIQSRQSDRNSTDVQFEWTYLPDGAAYLRMPTWALFNSKWDWKGWLNTHLDELVEHEAPALIIDLRGNEGGLDVGNTILSRIIQRDLPLTQTKRLVRYRKIPDSLAPYLDTWDPSFKDWGAAAVDLPQSWPTAPPVPYLALSSSGDSSAGGTIPAQGNRFRGRVLVLIDATNSSATFQFAQIVQANKLGTLVGEPTGGSQRGINGGAFFFLRLPNSHIEMDLPLIGYYPASSMPDSGLTPDIAVTPTKDDLAHNRDVVLAAATRFIHSQPSLATKPSF